MPWEKPTLRQLFERISQDFSGRLLDGGPVLSRSVIAVLAKVWAGAAWSMHAVLEWIFRQVFVDTAEDENLVRWANAWGMEAKGAAYASGKVIFQGAAGAILPAGRLLQPKASTVQYVVLEDAVIVDGSASASVRAMTPGIAGNLPAGTAVSLVAPVVGLQSAGEVDGDGLSGGTEEEDMESLRARLLARLRMPPRGGAKHDYEAWALEVSGVTRAWGYPLGEGIGTVSLTFVMDNAPDGPIPDAQTVQRVQEHIDRLKPASVKEFLAFAPEPLPVHIRLAVSPDTEAVRASVRAELADLIAREAAPGKTLYRSHISEAVSLAPDETDHVLIEPAGDIDVPPGYFPMIGNVVFEPYGGPYG